MIIFKKIIQDEPYIILKQKYDEAFAANQQNIEAISISSFNKETNEVESRYVNLKFIDQNEFVFFSNYNSPKSLAFNTHDQISALFYWPSINTQIRMKARIKKTSTKYNDEYFKKRSAEKNALAISSNQSKIISSYENVVSNYEYIKEKEDLTICPNHWGGFSFTPFYFEFWKGHNSRLNKRDMYKKVNGTWKHFILEP